MSACVSACVYAYTYTHNCIQIIMHIFVDVWGFDVRAAEKLQKIIPKEDNIAETKYSVLLDRESELLKVKNVVSCDLSSSVSFCFFNVLVLTARSQRMYVHICVYLSISLLPTMGYT